MRKKTAGILYINFAILAVAALLYLALASPAAVTTMIQPQSFPVYRGSSKTAVSLQCTVTWDAAALSDILDVLKAEDVRITFAVSGSWAQSNSGLLERMAREGHEIAVMGFEPQSDGGVSFVKRDVRSSLETVYNAVGVRPATYYCGSRSSGVSAKAGSALGLTTVLCSADLDCASADPGLILKRLRSAASPGSIINVQPTGSLLKALPQIVNYLKNMGLAIVPVHKMLYN